VLFILEPPRNQPYHVKRVKIALTLARETPGNWWIPRSSERGPVEAAANATPPQKVLSMIDELIPVIAFAMLSGCRGVGGTSMSHRGQGAQ
jgi:hypothetical protein